MSKKKMDDKGTLLEKKAPQLNGVGKALDVLKPAAGRSSRPGSARRSEIPSYIKKEAVTVLQGLYALAGERGVRSKKKGRKRGSRERLKKKGERRTFVAESGVY